MLLLAAWTTNGWMPSGHALRMALDLGLHRALGKLAEDNKRRSEEEERHLGMLDLVSVIKWLRFCHSGIGTHLALPILVRSPVGPGSY